MIYNCQQLFQSVYKDLNETYLITNEFQIAFYKVLLEKNLYETYLITNELTFLFRCDMILWIRIRNLSNHEWISN